MFIIVFDGSSSSVITSGPALLQYNPAHVVSLLREGVLESRLSSTTYFIADSAVQIEVWFMMMILLTSSLACSIC